MHFVKFNKKIWLSFFLCTVTAIFVYFTMFDDLSGQRLGSQLIEEGRLSQAGHKLIIDATASNDVHQLRNLFERNSNLVSYLSSQVQLLPLENEWSQIDVQYFLLVSSSLLHLLESSEKKPTMQILNASLSEKQKMTNYLGAFISVHKRRGNGYISSLSEISQRAVGSAFKLLSSLNEDRNLKQEILDIAVWYKNEKAERLSSKIHLGFLLEYAWELSSIDLKLDLNSLKENEEIVLADETDLTRLLSHSAEVVVKNSAHLISIFVPQHASTALRYQLVRSVSNSERFLLLDAIKQYGDDRNQIELQLRKMLSITNDTNFQKKIVETINYLHGRPNELKSSS